MCVFAQNPIINYLRRRPSQASIHLTDIYARYRKTYSRVSFDPFPSAGFLFPRAGEEHSIRRFLAKKPPLSRGFPLGALPILGHIALLCPRRWGIKIISTPLGKSVYFCSVELQERVLFYFPFGFISLLLLLLRISFTFRFGLVFHF